MNPDDTWAPIRDYSAGKRRRLPWEVGLGLVIVIGLVAWFFLPAYLHSRRSSEEKQILDRVFKYLVATDYFILEHPDRLFVRREEMTGAAGNNGQPIEAVAGEDYAGLFPIRRDHPELAVRTADGRQVIWFMYASKDGWGERGMVTVRPDGEMIGESDVIKAYRQFREGEKTDGVHTKQFPDGSRFETTYRGGVPHGPFKAYRPDGKLWGEANYEHGRLTGPCWNYPASGERFDEMQPRDYAKAIKAVK
ncbi:MAG TPA: hypothetical protein VG734_27140 [Lacunisphaera sp.]|nr:hypothetical protein [Lacunisphaera sp.]